MMIIFYDNIVRQLFLRYR